MPIGDNKKNPPKVLAQSIREPGRARGNHRHDMRLVATPMRYKVQVWDYDIHSVIRGRLAQSLKQAWQQGTSWQDVQRMKRTRNKFVDWELDCAIRMFERRLREQMGEMTGTIWQTRDKRKLPLHQMGTAHLRNCLHKCAIKQWRKQFIPTIIAELKNRGEYENEPT